MAKKRPATPRRSSKKKSSRGRIDVPAALVFALGIVLAVGLIWWAQKTWFQPVLPQMTAKPSTATPGKGQPPSQAPAAGQQAAHPGGQTGARPQTPADEQPGPQTGVPAPGHPSAGAPAGALLTIVIDDLGGSLPQAHDVLDLDLPLTLSILPNLAHTHDVDALAAKAGAEVLLHQPMEAWDKNAEAAGPGVLKTGMTAAEAGSILAANLAQTPHAVGLNNHMGSKGTEDAVLMRAVMAELKARALLFLDSRTTEHSLGDKEAARLGVPFLARAVFLDNEHGQQAAILMLKEAERLALTRGRAIAIGHPHPETLAALSAWSIRRDQRIKLVTLGRQLKGN